MARYIDYVKLIDLFKDSLGNTVLCAFLVSKLKELPTEDVVKVVKCKDCKHSEELAKHCEINRKAYRHCKKQRGEEIRNVWHKYTKHYRDYNIVDCEGFCSSGEERR